MVKKKQCNQKSVYITSVGVVFDRGQVLPSKPEWYPVMKFMGYQMVFHKKAADCNILQWGELGIVVSWVLC
jgi:hypothetical protein